MAPFSCLKDDIVAFKVIVYVPAFGNMLQGIRNITKNLLPLILFRYFSLFCCFEEGKAFASVSVKFQPMLTGCCSDFTPNKRGIPG